MWGKYLEVLGNFESTAGLRNTLTVGESGGILRGQVGQKRSLHESEETILADHHVPDLISLLSECAHKWEEIAIMLRLPQHVIEECRTGSSNFIKLNSVLLAWIRQDRARPATLQGLSKVLSSEAVNMHSLGETLHDKFKKHLVTQEPGIKKPRLSSQGNIIVVNDGMFTLLGVQGEYGENNAYQWLKDGKRLCDNLNFYCTTEDVLLIRNVRQGLEGKYSCTQDGEKVFEMQIEVKFSPEKKKLLNKYSILEAVPNSWPPIGTSTYIELALVYNQKSTKCDYSVRGDMDDILEKKDKIQYEELFAEHRDRTLLVVEGRPGCGKTTLTHKISRDWAKGPDILKGAQYVFLIPLRLFSKINAKSLPGILNIIFWNEKTSKDVADLLEKLNGEGACFIIDGLDEYPDRNDPTDIVHLILHKECLPLAMVIVASRPAGTAELRQLAQKRIEVLGFSKTQILKYLEEYDFEIDVNGAMSLKNYLSGHVNVYHMCYLPVHAAMICYIYDNNHGKVPNTETKIYNLFTLLTIKRKLSIDGDQREVRGLDKLKGDVKESFSKICNLAFDMMVSSEQAMFQSESENCFSDVIGSKVHSLGLVTIDSTARLLGFVDLYAFLHLTFQEFLAAYHLSTLDRQDQLRLVSEHREKSDMNVVWKFFCGLVNFNDDESSILAQIMTTKSSSSLFRFQCALESQQKVVCNASFRFKGNGDGSVVIKDHNFLSIDLNAMGFAIANTNFLVKSLILENCSLNSDGVQSFIEQVGPTKLDLIKSIQFSTNGDTEQFKILNLLLNKLDSLEFLHLAGMELKSNNIEVLTDNIELPNLKVLVIRMPLAQYSDMKSVHLLSFNSPILEQVLYDYVDADHESHKTCLLNLLKHFSCEVVSLSDPPQTILCNLDVNLVRVPNFLNISTLLLVNCNVNDEGVSCLKNVGINIIETLRLDFNKITCCGARLISECLKLYNRLHTLSISCNLIGDVGAFALSEALQNNSLLELDLQGNKIGNDGAIAIAKAVERFPSDSILTIWNIKITLEGADKVLKYRPNAHVKNQHEICARKYIITNSPDAMTRAVSCCANLVSLDFSGKRITHHAAEALATSIKCCIHLKSLNLDNCGLSFRVLQHLGEGLQKCRNLASVNFGSNRIQSNDVPKLITPLKLCSSLKKLDLHNNPLKYTGIDSLIRDQSKYQLESLNLHNTMIDQYGAALLAKYLRLGARTRPFSHKDLVVNREPYRQFLLYHLNKGVKELLRNRGAIHSWHTSLIVLDLGKNRINSEGAAALAYGFKYCTKLKTLNLSQNNIDASGASMLAHGFKGCSELKKLILCNNPLKADGATSLFTALKSCNNLQVLYCRNIDLLSSSNVKEKEKLDSSVKLEGIAALALALKSWNNFMELDISSNNVNCKGGIELAEGLKQVKHLEKLDISNNKIATDGMTALSKILKNAYLTYLDLYDNSITHVGALAVGEILSNCNKIASLNISSNDIGTAGAEILGNGLKNCPHLIEIHLIGCKIGSQGVKLLMDGLKYCTKLKYLSLSNNNIGFEGVAELISVIKYFCELKVLDLGENNIGIDGCKTLRDWLLSIQPESSLDQDETQSLHCFQKFEALYLENCNLGSGGASEVANGLQNCSTFQELNLEGNNIGSAGVVQLGEKLKHCQNLRWVQLNNNQIDSASAIELAKHLKCCTNLWRLDIAQNLSVDLLALTDILRHCRIYSEYGWTSYDQQKRDRQHGWKKRNEDDWYDGGEIHLEGDGDSEQEWMGDVDSERDWMEDNDFY